MDVDYSHPHIMQVLIYDHRRRQTIRAHLSAYCATCGARRGTPTLQPLAVNTGETVMAHCWANPCGHPDTHPALLDELESQCAHPSCTLLASAGFYPYCGSPCARLAGRETVFQLNFVADILARQMSTILVIRDICERAGDIGARVKNRIDSVADLVNAAQDALHTAALQGEHLYMQAENTPCAMHEPQ